MYLDSGYDLTVTRQVIDRLGIYDSSTVVGDCREVWRQTLASDMQKIHRTEASTATPAYGQQHIEPRRNASIPTESTDASADQLDRGEIAQLRELLSALQQSEVVAANTEEQSADTREPGPGATDMSSQRDMKRQEILKKRRERDREARRLGRQALGILRSQQSSAQAEIRESTTATESPPKSLYWQFNP